MAAGLPCCMISYGGDDDVEKARCRLLLSSDGSLFGTLERKVFHYDPKSQQYAMVDVNTNGSPGPSLLAGFAGDGAIVGFCGNGIGQRDIGALSA